MGNGDVDDAERISGPALLVVGGVVVIGVVLAVVFGIIRQGGTDPLPGPDMSPAAPARPSSDETSVADDEQRSPRTSTPSDKPSSTVDDTQPSNREVADQALLLQVQSGDYPYFSTVPDGQLVTLARSVCDDLGDGYGPYELSFQIADGLPQSDEVEAAAFVGAAMGAYCPRHKKKW